MDRLQIRSKWKGFTNDKVFFTIKNKLIFTFVVILLVPTVLLSYVSYQTARQNVDSQMVSSSKEAVELIDALLNDFFASKMQQVDALSRTVDLSAVKAADNSNIGVQDSVRRQLLMYREIEKDADMVFVGTKNGLYMDSADATKMAADYDPRERAWFKQAVENKGKIIITSPYISSATGNLVFTVAKETADGRGVAAMSISTKKLAEITRTVSIGTEGFVFISDMDRKFVYHPTSEIGSPMPEGEMTSNLYKTDTGYFQYTMDGALKKMVFSTNSSSGWKIGGTMYESEIADAASPILKSTLIVLVLSTLIGSLMVAAIIFSILKPLRKINEASLLISEGDLTKQIEIARADELGTLSSNFNKMASSLRALIYKVNDNAMQLAASAEQLSASSEQITEAGKQVAQAVQEIANGSAQQVVQIGETNREMNDMASQLQAISHNTDAVSDSAQHTQETAQDGTDAIRTVIDQMNAIGQKVKTLSDDVTGLGDRSKQIVSFTTVIAEIASQTNLLALNASIEAARAGEQGKGFAVVAAEIKKLAEQSSASAKQISQLIAAIQKDTDMTAANMETVTHEVEQGMVKADMAGRSFEQILSSLDGVAVQIAQVSQATQGMAANSENVLNAVDAVSHISEDTAACIEQVAASTEEQLASMEEIASSSALLSKMAEELQETVAKFKV
ncbi:methyl-accepting chemotaxis protein [Paenibacillus tyrfis]|uniref:methyl-accepting chemotaxis protein n=1 Tax=Paenibacillus tyrfis TaxID=1501230 RepID=UPI0020A08050|nr:methyl-accepting chemotaxis protein [Paenibacillus tyrfis]MCP1309488.1 methyl-accepting chemotaxis protein [Paenibacillus tyrfis]